MLAISGLTKTMVNLKSSTSEISKLWLNFQIIKNYSFFDFDGRNAYYSPLVRKKPNTKRIVVDGWMALIKDKDGTIEPYKLDDYEQSFPLFYNGNCDIKHVNYIYGATPGYFKAVPVKFNIEVELDG